MDWRKTHPFVRLEWECPKRRCRQTGITVSRVRNPPVCRAHGVPMQVKRQF